MKTILISLVLGNLFTLILIMAYRFQSEQNRAINTFMAAKFARLIAWSMIGLRTIIPDLLSISFANSILILGTSLESVAILLLMNIFNKDLQRVYTFITVFFILFFNGIVIFNNAGNLRIAVSFLSSAILLFLPIYCLLLNNKNSSLLQRIFGFIYCTVIIEFIVQVVMAVKFYPSMTLFGKNIFLTWSFLSIYIVMILENTGFILLAKEKSDLELIRMASIDDLTGIFNRRAFNSNAETYISLFARKKEPISFILIDLDHFKLINDTYGHDIGDLVLIDFSMRIKEQLRTYDLFGRYGGEEFTIILPGTNSKESNEVAERLRKSIEKSTMIRNIEIKYTISLGIITVIPDDKMHIDLFYKLGDNALYNAKKNGRNCVIRTKNDNCNDFFTGEEA